MNAPDIEAQLAHEFDRRVRLQIDALAAGIKHAGDWRQRLSAIGRYYRAVSPEILAQDPRHWALDPYEVDWPMLFTPIEAALWSDIRRMDLALYPQYPIDVPNGRTFFADFANPAVKVAVECDGTAFHTDAKRDRDRDRDAAMRKAGWTVYRFTGAQCRGDFNEETMQRSEVSRSLERIARAHCTDAGLAIPSQVNPYAGFE